MPSFEHFMVYKSIDCRRFVFVVVAFYNNMDKVRAGLASFSFIFPSDVIFLLCKLIDNSYEPISAREVWQLLWKYWYPNV